jgi:hypothetical protein
MLELPFHIPLLFILTTLGTFVMFILSMVFDASERVTKRAHVISLLLLMWVVFQSTLALNNWFMDREAMPPHLVFPIVTASVIMMLLFFTSRGRRFLDGMSWKWLMWIHIVRIPVEICLHWLAEEKQIPYSMTWSGYNFDIIFGLSGPIVAVLYFNKQWISDKMILLWNILGLISLIAIVVRSAGALPSPLQAWDFSTPNYAMIHFPFIWLPSFIVPIVLLSHLVGIRRALGYDRKVNL